MINLLKSLLGSGINRVPIDPAQLGALGGLLRGGKGLPKKKWLIALAVGALVVEWLSKRDKRPPTANKSSVIDV